MASSLNFEFSKKTHIFHLKVWILLAIFLGVFLVAIVLLLPFCVSRKTKKKALPVTHIPVASKEIREMQHSSKGNGMDFFSLALEEDKSSNKDSVKLLSSEKARIAENESQYGSFNTLEKDESSGGGSSNHSPLSGLPEFSHLGWGHWFTLRDLEIATNKFSVQNIVGEGGYGVVYLGQLVNGTPVAVKKIFNNIGQAEKEFRVEVEAIGRGRHKNLVRLLGYCVEGTQRLLVYEYVNNGNLEQWIHGGMSQHGILTWEARMKVLIGTAKALAYLHEALEPKVVHRDIKSGNILIDDEFNAKLSDFGLAKLLGAGKSHITTRVMGTFGYVAPEYANSGLLNEKSDVYSFGVVLLEAISGRDPVDYDRPAPEVNLVEWLKTMVGSKRFEVVVDPKIETKPSTAELKRALLTALRCVDPDADKRPVMSQVVRMLESEEYPISREGRRKRRNEAQVECEAKQDKKERPIVRLLSKSSGRQQEK